MATKNLQTIIFLSVFTITLGSSLKIYAQQDPLYTHYMFNKHVYNPAFTGTNREFICATFLLHNQWAGFEGPNKEKGPVTQTFSIHGALKNPYLGGIGLYVVNDEQGFEYTRAFNLTFSGKYDFTFGSLHYGLNGGMVEKGIDGEWEPPEPGENDPRIPGGKESDMIPDLGAGIYLYTERYFIGASAQHLLGGSFDWGTSINDMVLQTYLSGGVNFYWPTNRDILVKPSFLVKIDPAKIQFDINTNVLYKERFWAGLQYRQQDAISLLLGMKLTPELQFGYSYDLTTTELLNYSSGTHEVLLNYCFKIVTKPRVIIPNIIWTPRYM